MSGWEPLPAPLGLMTYSVKFSRPFALANKAHHGCTTALSAH